MFWFANSRSVELVRYSSSVWRPFSPIQKDRIEFEHMRVVSSYNLCYMMKKARNSDVRKGDGWGVRRGESVGRKPVFGLFGWSESASVRKVNITNRAGSWRVKKSQVDVKNYSKIWLSSLLGHWTQLKEYWKLLKTSFRHPCAFFTGNIFNEDKSENRDPCLDFKWDWESEQA